MQNRIGQVVSHHKTFVFSEGPFIDVSVEGLVLTPSERDYFLAWHLGVRN